MDRLRLAAALLGALALAATSAVAAAAPSAIPTDPLTTHRSGRPVLGANQVALGGRVPWDRVGHGWYLTLIDQGTRGDHGIDPDHQLLDLVDPFGGRYQLEKTDVGQQGHGYRRLTDWSADGRRALVLVDGGTPGAYAVDYHLRSGRGHVIPLSQEIAAVSLGPHHSIYASTYGGNGGALLRFDDTGTREVLLRHTDGMAMPSPDGHRVVVAPAGYHQHTFQVLSGHGTVVRTLDLPHKCSATRWWAVRTVMASCYTRLGPTRLYAVPVDGSAPTPISARHGRNTADLGALDARELGGTTYLESAGPCGEVFLARQHAGGSATEVPVPGSTGNVYLLGTRGHRLVLQTGFSCDGGPSHDAITHFDPATHADRVVAELPVSQEYGTVLAFGERRTTIG